MTKTNDQNSQNDSGKNSVFKSSVSPKDNSFLDFWGPIFFTIALYLGIKHYIAEARYIPSGSMLPSLQLQDRLLIEKLTFRRRSPRRGEIVVFNSPYAFDAVLKKTNSPLPLQCSFLNFPLIALIPGLNNSTCVPYIKRVVAIEGDKVRINSRGEVRLNNIMYAEPYVDNFCSKETHSIGLCKSMDLIVPKGHVIVLGDNRANSCDSRCWPGGPFVPTGQIIGRAVFRFWPLARVGFLKP